MGWNWKKLIGRAAPAIAKALGVGGGPAGVAIAVLSKALLGHDKGDEGTVAAAIEAGLTPEQASRLMEAEQEFTLKLVDTAVALEKIEADDRANARTREITLKDRMPALLAWTLTAAVVAMLGLLAFRVVPAENREPFLIVLGNVMAAWGAAMAYYHGSSSGSKAKDVVLARVAGR